MKIKNIFISSYLNLCKKNDTQNTLKNLQSTPIQYKDKRLYTNISQTYYYKGKYIRK